MSSRKRRLAGALSLDFFETAIELFHRAGNVTNLAHTFGDVVVYFKRIDQPEIAATLYGASTARGNVKRSNLLRSAVNDLRAVLGDTAFNQRVTVGAAMEPGEAAQYAREQIRLLRHQTGSPQRRTSIPSTDPTHKDWT